MSHLVFAPLVAAAAEIQTVHLVPPGEMRCMRCGLTKLRMRFAYSDEIEVMQAVFDMNAPDPVALYDPQTNMLNPYVLCEVAYGNTSLQ